MRKRGGGGGRGGWRDRDGGGGKEGARLTRGCHCCHDVSLSIACLLKCTQINSVQKKRFQTRVDM
jgi:hypothetical protein